jgi:acetyl esterase/lipase
MTFRGTRTAAWRVAAASSASLLVVGMLAGAAPRADSDVLVFENGKTAVGAAFRAGEEVRLNTFRCSVPEMTLGVKVFRARDVKRIDPDEDEPWIVERLDVLLETGGATLVAELASLHGLAKRKGYRELAKRLAEEALARGSTDAELAKAAGGAAPFAARRRGDVRLDAGLAGAVGRLIALERAAERRSAAARLVAESGLALAPTTIERMAASLAEPVGVLEEAALGWTNPDVPAGRYSVFVPPDLHPLEPVPLVLALHGGGEIAREDGTKVLAGTGKDALRLLMDGAEARGWMLLCPTALESPWDSPRNRAFLEALLAEVTARWNVDLSRVHLFGVGEGGDGAWALGTAWAERLASVSAASAKAPTAASGLAGRGIGVWIGHGDEDERYPVLPVRKAAERLLDAGADFVYCEVPKQGHAFTGAQERDWYRYVAGRRNPRAKSGWPEPSFAQPVGAAEKAARGDPAWAWGGQIAPDAKPEVLWEALAKDRTDAEAAAERLKAVGGAEVAGGAQALLTDRKAPLRVRRHAAWLLGALGDPGAAVPLGDVLRAETDPLLRLEAARALKRLARPESKEDLRFALLDVWQLHQRATFPENRVPFVAYERVARLAGALVEALARVGTADDLAPDIEQTLVLGLLKDARPVEARRGPGGDPAGPRIDLVRSIARAYRTLGAERTLVDMLRTVVKKEPAAQAALAEGLAQGVK